jgi:hypothetical protein
MCILDSLKPSRMGSLLGLWLPPREEDVFTDILCLTLELTGDVVHTLRSGWGRQGGWAVVLNSKCLSQPVACVCKGIKDISVWNSKNGWLGTFGKLCSRDLISLKLRAMIFLPICISLFLIFISINIWLGSFYIESKKVGTLYALLIIVFSMLDKFTHLTHRKNIK